MCAREVWPGHSLEKKKKDTAKRKVMNAGRKR